MKSTDPEISRLHAGLFRTIFPPFVQALIVIESKTRLEIEKK